MSLHRGLLAAFGGWGGLQTTMNAPLKEQRDVALRNFAPRDLRLLADWLLRNLTQIRPMTDMAVRD